MGESCFAWSVISVVINAPRSLACPCREKNLSARHEVIGNRPPVADLQEAFLFQLFQQARRIGSACRFAEMAAQVAEKGFLLFGAVVGIFP